MSGFHVSQPISPVRLERAKLVSGTFNAIGLALVGAAVIVPLVKLTYGEPPYGVSSGAGVAPPIGLVKLAIFGIYYTVAAVLLHAWAHAVLRRLDEQ